MIKLLNEEKSSDPPDEPGRVMTELAALPETALLDEAALARALGVCPRTVRRMVIRHELPPGFKLGAKKTWLVGRILDWLHERAKNAEQEALRAASKIRRLNS